jgi:Tfp pilus assembly protein PilO
VANAKAAAPKVNPAVKAQKAVAKHEISTNNYIAIVAVVTLLVVLVCGFVGKFLISSIILNTKVVAGETTATFALDTKLKNIPVLIDNYHNLGDKQKLIKDGLPNTADFPQIISIAQNMASQAGVQLKSVSPESAAGTTSSSTGATAATSTGSTSSGSTSTPSGAQPYTYSVTVVGSYSRIVDFFRNVELSVRPMKVVQTEFNGDSGNVSVDAKIQTYYQDKAKIDDSTEVVK